MPDGKKTFGDSYATVMIGIFCTLGSMVYVTQLPFQYPFAHKADVAAVKTEVAAVKTEVNASNVQSAVASEKAMTATDTATKAETVAKKVKNEDLAICLKGQAETDRRVQALRMDITRNQMDIAKIKRKLGIQ